MTTQFPETFDPETQEGNSWELLPADEYVAQVVEASVQQPNSGDGFYLTLTWKIVEGAFEGRQVWQNITLMHSNEQAQTIGRKTLKDLCVALDVNEQVNDAKVFLFKPARIKVGIDAAAPARGLGPAGRSPAHRHILPRTARRSALQCQRTILACPSPGSRSPSDEPATEDVLRS